MSVVCNGHENVIEKREEEKSLLMHVACNGHCVLLPQSGSIRIKN